MKATTNLLWKEWQETKTYLFIGLGIFVAIPVIDALEQFLQHIPTITVQTSPWVLLFTGPLSVFIAVGIVCRDFHGHLEDFWRSRPWLTVRWLLIKYFLGLAAAIIPPILALGMEYWFHGTNYVAFSAPLAAVFYGPYQTLAVYSVAFAFGCLIRRTANAAMLGLAAMLLIYFLPLILPPLDFMNSVRVLADINGPVKTMETFVESAVGTIVIAIVSVAISIVAVKRDWHIISGQKMMFSSIATVLLVLMGTIAFQVGSNLPIIQKFTLPTRESVLALDTDGEKIWMSTNTQWRQVYVKNSEIELGPLVWTYAAVLDAWPKANPIVSYRFDVEVSDLPNGTRSRSVSLQTWPLIRSSTAPTSRPTWISKILLWQENIGDAYTQPPPWPRMFIWKDRIFLFGASTITVDISLPTNPKIISDTPEVYTWTPRFFYITQSRMEEHLDIPLPQLESVPARQRLAAAFNVNPLNAWLDGDDLCISDRFGIHAYHLKLLNDQTAVFEKVGQYEPTFLEIAFGMSDYGQNTMWLKNGLLYASSRVDSEYGRSEGRGPREINPIITVFDLHGPHPMSKVGHFAAPNAGIVCPLSDGRALIGGGNDLYLVGPPPSRK